MIKIKCTTLSGKEHEVTDNFSVNGMGALWNAYQNEKNTQCRRLLQEAHTIMLDKHIAEQSEQREILAKLAYPYDQAELCELVDELEELIMSTQ